MPIPDFQTVMLPLLRHLEQGERNGPESVEALAAHFGLTPEEVAMRIPSGLAPKFANRIEWAKSHLKMAGLIESPRRGVYRLTTRGRQMLDSNPSAVTLSVLSQFPEYVAFRSGKRDSEIAAELFRDNVQEKEFSSRHRPLARRPAHIPHRFRRR